MITPRSLASARPILVGLALGVASALGSAACGDDAETGSGGGAAASSGVASTSATTTATTTSAASGGEGGGGAGGAPNVCAPPAGVDIDPDTAVPGPFSVRARTVEVEGLTVEVWYPSSGGPDDVRTYDIREHLPESERDKIATEDTPLQYCSCGSDGTIDEADAPYPVVIFVHGTAGFRTQSLELVTHWASRGFVVLAADHPGLQLRNLLELACGQANTPRDLDADLAVLHDAVRDPRGDLDFLAGRIDASRLALVGHSAGGAAIEQKGDIARVLIPLAAGGVQAGDVLESTLIMGSVDDEVVAFSAQEDGFATSPAPKRLVGLAPAGHLAFSSLCSLRNEAGQNIVEIGVEAEVCGLGFADGLFDCSDEYIDDEIAWTIIQDATSAALEESLFCLPERGEWLSGIADRHAEVATFEEEL